MEINKTSVPSGDSHDTCIPATSLGSLLSYR